LSLKWHIRIIIEQTSCLTQVINHIYKDICFLIFLLINTAISAYKIASQKVLNIEEKDQEYS
ncbi:hypothetical protein, partial [Acinetobacter baumannii]|uniref:hypothetical protein n=1 Tax=Acinetobacter baumannii TaxID=470 RepID=UPI001C4696B9